MTGHSQQPNEQRPLLWNPNAAANWSLLLTPAFGAYLHASNWRALGKAERATANMTWVWTTVVFLSVSLVTLFLPSSKTVDSAMRYAGLALLLGWYFTQGRVQAKYVKETLPGGYTKKSWGATLAIGFAGIAAYTAILIAITVALHWHEINE